MRFLKELIISKGPIWIAIFLQPAIDATKSLLVHAGGDPACRLRSKQIPRTPSALLSPARLQAIA